MSTRKIVRPADVTAADATAQIKEAGYELVSLKLIDASGQRVASADAVGRNDLQWEATVKVAEFPFSEDEGEGDKDGEDKGPSDDTDAPESSDDDEPKDEAPDGPPKDEEPKEPKSDKSADADILDLVKEIAKHLGIPVPGEEDPMLDAPVDDIGVGPEAPAPDLGGAPEEEPLPLPVEKKGPVGMGGILSHIVVANSDAIEGRRSFVAVVSDANGLNDGEIVNEAHVAFPGYRVAGKIDRKTLLDQNEARVPMVTKG